MRACVMMVALAIASLATAFGATPSAAALRIANDTGGLIGTYVETYTAARNAGERVVIDGRCLSACTLVLGIVPRARICVTENATLGFHAAWVPDGVGGRVRSAAGTRAIWGMYPPAVRRWISRNGGLAEQMIFLRGAELAAIYPPCH